MASGRSGGARPVDETVCSPAVPTEPSRFLLCEEGSGSFGRWIVDEQELPAFSYEADQTTDPRAEWELTTGEIRTDHLFQIDNDQLIVVLDNDGFAQVFTRDRMR